MDSQPGDEIDVIFDTPLREFVSTRDEVVARLKSEGRMEDAARVKALRKPPLSAWAVNQVARRDPDGMQALVAAGEDVRAALEAGDRERLATASALRRQSVAGLRKRAAEILEDAGHAAGADTLERVARTLQAAAADPVSGAEVVAGRLTADLEPGAVEGFLGAVLPEEETPETEDEERAARRDAAVRAAEQAEQMAAELEAEADEAERAFRSARRRAEEARRAASAARARARGAGAG